MKHQASDPNQAVVCRQNMSVPPKTHKELNTESKFIDEPACALQNHILVQDLGLGRIC